jgi:hypothetical protein
MNLDYNIGQIHQFFDEPKKLFFAYNSDRREYISKIFNLLTIKVK